MSKTKKVPSAADIIAKMNKMGKQSQRTMASGSDITLKEKVSTGSLYLDQALGGGYVKGRIIECYSAEGFGKSTLGFAFLSTRPKEVNGFVDAESCYNRETAQMCGVNTDNLIVAEKHQMEHLEASLQVTMDMINSGVTNIMYDSIAGMPPKVEVEGSIEDDKVANKAKRLNQVFRQLDSLAHTHDCTIFFVNQTRASLSMYGSPVVTPGGGALKFAATYRLWIKSISEKLKIGEEVVGHVMRVHIKKNKLGTPGVDVNVPLVYGHGISNEWEIMEMCLDEGVITQSGAWFKQGEDTICQGKGNLFSLLIDNPEYLEELKTKLYERKSVDTTPK